MPPDSNSSAKIQFESNAWVTQIVEALPKRVTGATNPDLKQALSEHLKQTKTRVDRIEKILKKLEFSPEEQRCNGMEGLLEEGKHALEADVEPAIRTVISRTKSRLIEPRLSTACWTAGRSSVSRRRIGP